MARHLHPRAISGQSGEKMARSKSTATSNATSEPTSHCTAFPFAFAQRRMHADVSVVVTWCVFCLCRLGTRLVYEARPKRFLTLPIAWYGQEMSPSLHYGPWRVMSRILCADLETAQTSNARRNCKY
eukprot:13999-Prymnesium_polylepis.1